MSNIQLPKKVQIDYHDYTEPELVTHHVYDETEGWKRWNTYVSLYIRDNDRKQVFFDWQNKEHTDFISRVVPSGAKVEVSVHVIEPEDNEEPTIDDIHNESSDLRKSISKELDRLSELVLKGQEPFGKNDEAVNKEYSRIKKIRKTVQSLGY